VEKDIYQVALCWRNSKTKREKNKNKRWCFLKSECADHDGSESIVIEKETTVTVSIPTCKTHTLCVCNMCSRMGGINVLEESRLEISFRVCFYLIDLCVFCFPTHIVGGQKQKQNQMEGGIRQGDPQTWPFRNDPLPSIPGLDNSRKKFLDWGIGGETMLSAPAEVISLNFCCLFRIDLVFPMSDNQLK
jgi:hypothetical protein